MSGDSAQGGVVNVHALRHTFATRLARAAVSLQQAAYLTGHRTLAVLLQIYTHLQADDARDAVAKLSFPPRIAGTNPHLSRRGCKVAVEFGITRLLTTRCAQTRRTTDERRV